MNAPKTHRYCGSDKERAERGDPGHCELCALYGHVAAHPELGCADVGCDSVHQEEPTESRLATVDRAVMFLGGATPGTARAVLARTDVHARFKDDPIGLAAHLREANVDDLLRLFGKFKTAQRVLRAAGMLDRQERSHRRS